MTTLLWKVIWFLIGIVLNVGSDFVAKTITLVKEAETLKNEDGTPYDSTAKFNWVWTSLVAYGEEYNWDEKEIRVINLVIELSVNYLKTLKK